MQNPKVVKYTDHQVDFIEQYALDHCAKDNESEAIRQILDLGILKYESDLAVVPSSPIDVPGFQGTAVSLSELGFKS